MGFELVPGWTPGEPAPIALCDNQDCSDPIMPTTGWAIAALRTPDPARPGPARAVRTYLACGDACLTAIRARIGGAWSAPVPYGLYWRAISPVVTERSGEEGVGHPSARAADPLPEPSTPLTLTARRADWLAVAGELEQRGNGPFAAFVRAGLAFSPQAADPAPDAAIPFALTVEQAATLRAVAAPLGVRFAEEEPSLGEEVLAVAAAAAIVRAHQNRPRR